MKKIFLAVFVMLLANNAFCQTPLDKEQQKKVKKIHQQVSKEHGAILKNQSLTVNEKRDRVDASKTARDAHLAVFMTQEQVVGVMSKDPIDWNKVYVRIEKQELSRLKNERKQNPRK